jgi:hypothetical protein
MKMICHLKIHWRSYLIALIGCAFACAIVIFSDAFQQCMNKSYYESSDYEPEKGIAQILTTLQWTKVCTGEFLKMDGEAITAFFTLVVGLFTAALWRSTRALWDVTNSTLRHSERTAIRELRAYVSVKELEMQPFHGPDVLSIASAVGVVAGPIHRFRICAFLANGGQTPTRKALVNVNHVLRDDKLPDGFDYPDGDVTETATIGVGGIFGTPGIFVSIADVDKVKVKAKRLFFWGWVDYNDVFEDTPRHRTEFCYDVTADAFEDRGKIFLRFPAHGRYNGADGDCVRQPRPYEEPKSS